ncbi:hypothetical protein AAC387_Pa02g4853 [Persea americana]
MARWYGKESPSRTWEEIKRKKCISHSILTKISRQHNYLDSTPRQDKVKQLCTRRSPVHTSMATDALV